MVSTLPLRHEKRRHHATYGRKVAQPNGAVVVRRRPHRLHVHAAHGQGHGFVGDESRRFENGSPADATEWRGMAAGRLVPDDKKILLLEELSINESYLWLVDAATGQKTELTPHNSTDKVSYREARFSKDGKGIYVTTDKDSEFHRLAYLDLETKQPTYLTTSIHWEVETFDLAHDGKLLAFVTDEEGLSVLHVRDTTNGREMPLPHIPSGVISGVRWHKNGHELGFSLNNSRGSGDCYSVDVVNEKLERWTSSETAVKTESPLQAELIHWKSFDGKMISGFLHKPPAKFTGKRPVLVVIHGGPEGQSQPTFLGRNNYLLNE